MDGIFFVKNVLPIALVTDHHHPGWALATGLVRRKAGKAISQAKQKIPAYAIGRHFFYIGISCTPANALTRIKDVCSPKLCCKPIIEQSF